MSRKHTIHHHALSSHGSLELRERSEHLKHGSAAGGRRIEALLMEKQIDPLACRSVRKLNRSVRDRPSLSADHAATISISRRATAIIRRSNQIQGGRTAELKVVSHALRDAVRASSVFELDGFEKCIAGLVIVRVIEDVTRRQRRQSGGGFTL